MPMLTTGLRSAVIALDGSTLVFQGAMGGPMDDSNPWQRFGVLLRRAGFPKLRIHAPRHSWATIQLSMGTPAKVVQEQLGHCSIGVTLNTYSHVVPQMQQAAADAMDRALAVPSP